MLARLMSVTALVALTLGAAGAAHAIPDGGYLALGLGGAIASGDRGVPLEGVFPQLHSVVGNPLYDEMVRTDFGSGLAFELRFGYLIAGLVAPEIGLVGHGGTGFDEGAGYPTFTLRYHPVQHAIDLAERDWDANVYVGAGYAIGGYHPENVFNDDGKGWEGWALTFGLGFDYAVGERVSLGLDVKFALPQYGDYLVDWDDDIRATPTETPSTLVVIPTAQIVFHL